MHNDPTRAAAEGMSINRREAIRTLAAGSAAGLVAGGALAASLPSGDVNAMSAAIARLRAAWTEWQAAHTAWDLEPGTDRSAAVAAAYDAAVVEEDAAFDALLRQRPTTLAEAAERFAYLPHARDLSELLDADELLTLLGSFVTNDEPKLVQVKLTSDAEIA